jgi:uncharacterized membrane protein YphA (DoxX/SURF4 family)
MTQSVVEAEAIEQAQPNENRAERVIINFAGWSLAILSFYIFIFDAIFSVLFIFIPRLAIHLDFGGEAADFVACSVAVAAGLAMAALGELKKPRLARSEKARYWLQVVVRYFLAYIFLVYGFAKVFHNQFYSTQSTLDTPLGDISGIELTWRFFGYSYALTLFVAASQIAGSILLFFRRTTTLAALVLLPVISNIVIVNFTHKIPVKLYSIIYLIMVCYLLFLDRERLLALVARARPPAGAPSRRALSVAVKGLVIAAFLAFTIYTNYDAQAVDTKVTTPLQGVWEVSDYQVNGAQQQPDSSPSVWKKVYFDSDIRVSIRMGAPRPRIYYSTIDPEKQTILLENLSTGETFFDGSYELQSNDSLVLKGSSGDAELKVTLKRLK